MPNERRIAGHHQQVQGTVIAADEVGVMVGTLEEPVLSYQLKFDSGETMRFISKAPECGHTPTGEMDISIVVGDRYSMNLELRDVRFAVRASTDEALFSWWVLTSCARLLKD